MVCGAWCKILPFFCKSPVWRFFNIFWKFVIFLVLQWSKRKSANLFLSKKSSEKQKCVYKLFLSKPKIFKIEKMNHRIVRKANLFGYILNIQNIFLLLNSCSLVREVMIKTIKYFNFTFIFNILTWLKFGKI